MAVKARAVRSGQPRLLHVHLKDFKTDPETGRHKTVAVGNGTLPYPEIFRALASDGYEGAISMETHFRLNGSRKEASRLSMQGILEALQA